MPERVDRDSTAGVFLAALRELGDHDLTFTQLVAMLYLQAQGPTSVSELAVALGRSVAATGRLAEALVKVRLVARRDVPEDRRVKRLRLTAAGANFLDRLHRRRLVNIVRRPGAADDLPPDQRATVHEAIAILARHGRV